MCVTLGTSFDLIYLRPYLGTQTCFVNSPFKPSSTSPFNVTAYCTRTMARSWILTGQNGFDSALKYEEAVKSSHNLRDREVLVELRAASLNYRELAIANVEVSHAR